MTSRSPTGTASYEVGYGKPPSATKFGNRAQPKRSVQAPEAAPQNLAALLDGPELVERAGRRARVHAHEAMMVSLANLVLRKNKISAAKKFLQECQKAKLLEPEPSERTSGVLVVPHTKYPVFDFLVSREGLPPWDENIIAKAEAEYLRDLQILLDLKEQHVRGVKNDE
jgi:hypothetical protein